MAASGSNDGPFSTAHFSVLWHILHKNGMVFPIVLAEQTNAQISSVLEMACTEADLEELEDDMIAAFEAWLQGERDSAQRTRLADGPKELRDRPLCGPSRRKQTPPGADTGRRTS